MGVRSPAPTLQAAFMAPPGRPPLERTDRPKQRSEGHVLWGCNLEPTGRGGKNLREVSTEAFKFSQNCLAGCVADSCISVARTELVGIRTGLAARSELVDTPNPARPCPYGTVKCRTSKNHKSCEKIQAGTQIGDMHNLHYGATQSRTSHGRSCDYVCAWST